MRIGNEYAAKTLCKAVQACYNFSVYTEDGTNETTGRSCMENKLIRSKYFLYLTEFFAGMSVMAVELGASRLMAPYFSSSQIVWTVIMRHYDRDGHRQRLGRQARRQERDAR